MAWNKRWIILAVVLTSLPACSDVGGDQNDLLGSDLNDNGIRDDIDEHIKAQFANGKEQLAAAQYAKAGQRVFLISGTAESQRQHFEALKVINDLTSATTCIYSAFDGSGNSLKPAAVSQELSSLTFNTRDRIRSYKRFSEALDGQAWGLPDGDGCD